MTSISLKLAGNATSNSIILFVGGSGDTVDSFDEVIAKLVSKFPTAQFVTFSFRGVDNHLDVPLHQQVTDLEEVIHSVTKSNPAKRIICIATSMGAYSTALVLAGKTGGVIARSIFVDPADYSIDINRLVSQSRSWSGVDIYKPTSSTASDKMREISGDVRVDVIHFTLKNYTNNGYVPMPLRGVDNEGAVSRLNTAMVRSFFENTPVRNRGEYIENSTLPHAFMRDGDIQKNIVNLVSILSSILHAQIG